MKKGLNIIVNGIFIVVLVLIVIVAGYLVKSKIDGGQPQVAGHKIFIVLSDSMHPVFDTGSVVVVKNVDQTNIPVGSIITFENPDNQKMLITHRVAGIKKDQGQIRYITKGDANNAVDKTPVLSDKVIGEVQFSVPYAGYLFNFADSKKGLLVLVLLPGSLLIALEVRNIFLYLQEYEDDEKRKKAV